MNTVCVRSLTYIEICTVHCMCCAIIGTLKLIMVNYFTVLLYVREQHEVVFTAVMLRSPTLHGLLQAVSIHDL